MKPTFYLNRALLLEKTGVKRFPWPTDLKKAWEMDPSQWRHWQHLARYQAENGNDQEALSLLRDATRKFSGSYVLGWITSGVLNSLGPNTKKANGPARPNPCVCPMREPEKAGPYLRQCT